MNHSPTIKDIFINTPQGRLFSRSWRPQAKTPEAAKAPIILFHDSLGSVQLWRNFPGLLSEKTGRTVIAYDRLGFGQSEERKDKLSIHFIQEEAEYFFPYLREQLQVNHFVAFGHSVGGGMAIHCAATYSFDCQALITESAQAFVEDRTRAGILEARALFSQPAHIERLKKYHGEKSLWVIDAWIETWLAPDFSAWSLESVLPKVICPTLAIHGSEDEYGSRAHPEMIAQLVAGPSRLEIMAGIHHVPHREQEQSVINLISDYLSRH